MKETKTFSEQSSVCENDPWGRHRWYQTSLINSFNDANTGKPSRYENARSYACEKCHQWKTTPEPI